jgi:ATP-dependent RNA helicase RhlE
MHTTSNNKTRNSGGAGEGAKKRKFSGNASSSDNRQGANPFKGKPSNDSRSNEGRSNEGRSNEGRSFAGRSNEGRSNEGRSNEGRSFAGRSNEGRSNEGRSNEGRSFAGRSNEGRSNEGRSNEGRSNEGRSNEGRSFEGRSNDGRSSEGRSNSGRSFEGRSNGSRPGNSRSNDNRSKDWRGQKATAGKKSRKQKGSEIDLDRLVKRAKQTEAAAPYVASRTFQEFPLSHKVKLALTIRGYVHPTEIQDRSIDDALAGRDLIGIAQTGTGKTAAFLIPIIDRYLQRNAPNTALIMVPTRELAVQVLDEFNALTKKMNLHALKVIGGTSLFHDFNGLRRNPDVVIGTPGRLVDLADRGALHLEDFEVLVIDEFDRMLDMGFSKDVMQLSDAMKNRKQTMLFSATVDKSIQQFVDKLVTDPAEVRVTTGLSSADNVDQDIVYPVQGEDRFDTLVRMLQNPEFERVILFAETRHKVHRLAGRLLKENISAECIHGDKTQSARQTALNRFKRGNSQVLVATDVAARGIDVEDVTHVINYEVPRTYDSYIHRIGRTGRAGKAGIALTFID